MKRTLTLAVALLAVGGCARFSTVQTDISNEGENITRTITTKASTYTFFAGKSALASWKASQTDKTQGASVGSLNQESGGTNLTQLIEAVAAGVVRGLKP